MTSSRHGDVRAAIAAIAAGEMIVVVDDADRENEGDLVLAAEAATTEKVAFVVRHTTGILCAPMKPDRVERLDLPQMVVDNTDAHHTAFTVTVDHHRSGTGVAARDRAATFRALAEPTTQAGELRRPGHVFPLRARPGGVLERPGHTEAAVDLLELAGRTPVGLIGELVADDGSMLRGAGIRAFAETHGLVLVRVADLAAYRREVAGEAGARLRLVARSVLPTVFGELDVAAYRCDESGVEHLALVHGEPGPEALVRVHSECLTGDVLGSLRCDCGAQLARSLQAVQDEGAGVIVYLRGHEGRGIGLVDKIRAYALQDDGLDTVDANAALGLPVDARDYGDAAEILRSLGVHRVRLITNNPDKMRSLADAGLEVVERVALDIAENPHNQRYLRTKRDRMGHRLSRSG
ncbi:GTP cyclohydrolase II [Pimelobacter simplex]|uniref:GTP cyclohydrolase II n=1 Tax=Nocardioides simplex TaxID=2045 RepID=UPI003AAF64AE